MQQYMYIVLHMSYIIWFVFQGAFWGMIIAQAWGMVRFVLDFVYEAPACGEEDTRPSIVKDFNVYYHTCSQILLAFLAVMGISLFTSIHNLVFAGLDITEQKIV